MKVDFILIKLLNFSMLENYVNVASVRVFFKGVMKGKGETYVPT